MVEQEAGKRIYRWKRQWRILRVLQLIALSLGFALLICAVLVHMFPFAEWETVIFVSLFGIAFVIFNLIHPFWKIDAPGIARYLDRQFPELEESTGILLRPSNELSLLERLQQQKIKTLLTRIQTPATPLKKLGLSILVMITGFGFSFMISHFKLVNYSPETYSQEARPGVIKERVPAQIASFSLKISAPAYTGLPERKQQQFSVKAATGSLLKWEIRTNEPVKKLKLIFNDREVASLRSADGLGIAWSFLKAIHQPGFYQLELDGKKSDLYQLELIPDLPVSIRITQPKAHTTIDFGQPQRLSLTLHLNDDYGIKDAAISATMASGKGEGVSFTEKKLLFNTAFNNSKSMSLSKTINLKSLGMKPGDELYFFVKALDNHGQTSRSDVYFVSIVDTAELMSMAGMTNGINLVPEYFRSQRQIIMDTEKLLNEKPGITEESFKNRSNALGIDQRLLRLRYGKFLGEETETAIGADHDHDHGEGHVHEEGHAHEEGHEHEGEEHHEEKETKATPKFGDVKAIMDSYAHKHDIAEDATFFEPELKAQLKAVLTEMWSSELQLRTYKTREALPFEYKALRLLKDLQQKSRAYVAKTTVKVAQLKEEKRLSGELDKIAQPLQKSSSEPLDKKTALLKRALSALESRKAGAAFNTEELSLLRETEKYMVVAASDNPAVFLPALKGWRKLMTGSNSPEKEIEKVQGAIGKIIGQEQAVPQLPSAPPASNLYRKYFNALKKGEGANGI
ncbi:hypothetical protein DBR43_28735 [Pedobacter sp. KBW06]|uniref:hypothetical protein n=1 Tax=Pedobacter sp. KBW06 TaxID=2153359 RepID=UPI000F593F3E|nr:hypothetical protein [Pedobacter sp. KBW06]RQO66219.1 hypothetical protein DBR43_28735 [Pedobacter sp. KBW06]